MQNWCFVISFLLSYLLATDANPFKFEDCSNEDGIFKDVIFEITPDPIKFNELISVSMTGKLIKDVPTDARLKVQHYKLTSVWGVSLSIPIPCVKNYGSCTLPLCEYLDMYKEQVKPFFPQNRAYGCPVKSGKYGAKNVQIWSPDVSSTMRYMISGKYQTNLNLEDSDGNELACFKIFTELE